MSKIMKTSFARLLILCLLVPLLAGCAGFQPKPISTSDTVAALEARTLDNTKLRDFIQRNIAQDAASWPPKSWDLTLLTLAAFYYHPDVDVARAKWGVAEASIVTAGMRPNPGLGVSAQQNAIEPGGVKPWAFFWNLDIPVETAGKRGYRIAQARHLSEAARLNLADTAWKAYSRVRSSLVTLYAARESTTLLQEQETLQADIVKLLEHRFAMGEISQPEVTQARITHQQTLLALRESQRQESQARVELASAIGLPNSSLTGITLSFDGISEIPNPENLSTSEVRHEALLNRADILAALAEYEASQSDLQQAIAKQYPDTHLGQGWAWGQGWILGLTLTLPVFNQNDGPIAEAEARRRQAAASFTALEARALGEIDSALAAYRATAQKLDTADGLLNDQKKRQRSTQARFQAGDVDRLTLIETRLELLSTQLARLGIFVQEQQSLGLLQDAVQRPLTPIPLISVMNPSKEKNQK